jgi:hypothetical protein
MQNKIEWEEMKQNQDLSITLIEENKEYTLTAHVVPPEGNLL